jgi:outer membrane protein OmpA-like peptidoglycan-associated protein
MTWIRSNREKDSVIVTQPTSPRHKRRRVTRHARVAWVAVASLLTMFGLVTVPAGSTSLQGTSAKHPVALRSSASAFPTGTPDSSQPSGEAPPAPTGFPGYIQTYVNNFTGTSLPAGWGVFTGMASGDPGSQWGSAHVVVANGMLSLNTWQDPAYGNNWVSGGLCQCESAKTYGAYFVRSRVTGPGPTVVELLWPTVGWPPEIDFNETAGVTNGTSATVIWGASGGQSQVQLNIDMTQWHTWGVIWTSTSVIYTVDGRVWGSFDVPSQIPHQPMTLHLQQQTWCTSNFACPTSPQSTQVDWVAEYTAQANVPVPSTTVPSTTVPSTTVPNAPATIGPFPSADWTLTPRLKAQIASLASRVKAGGDRAVALTGYSDAATGARRAAVVSRNRAVAVKKYLLRVLTKLDDHGVVVTAKGAGNFDPVAAHAKPGDTPTNGRVTARVF